MTLYTRTKAAAKATLTTLVETSLLLALVDVYPDTLAEEVASILDQGDQGRDDLAATIASGVAHTRAPEYTTTEVDGTSSPYGLADTDYFYVVAAGAIPVSIVLLGEAKGKPFMITKLDGLSTVTVTVDGGGTIDGAASRVIAQYEVVEFIPVTGGYVTR